MAIVLGTLDGVWSVGDSGFERIGLGGRWVNHVAQRGGVVLAAISGDGVYELCGGRERRIFEGDARSCALGPDGSRWVGTEPAMVLRCKSDSTDWVRCDAIDALPTRGEWTFPPPPHQPHVLSIDFLSDEPSSVVVGIEVGGVIVSHDGGITWAELNEGVYVDVHSVRPDPSTSGLLVAVTGKGFYASEDGGSSWERRMEGVGNGYTVGVAVNPARAREVLVSAGDRPPGLNGRVYHSLDAGKQWVELEDPALPSESRRASIPFFAEGSAWIATDQGSLLRADDARSGWSLAYELPSCINAVSAEGSPSSVMH